MGITVSAVKSAAGQAKQKVAAAATAVSLAAVYATMGMAYCDNGVDANTSLRNLLDKVFTVLTVGGVISMAYGAVLLFRALTSHDAGDSNSLNKGIGWLVGGLIMIVIHPIITAILGKDPTQMTFI